MVLIGGIKYACERCIRGHRVTTCNHTDQPLMMIKPKGRPSSQCKHCKDMRKNKNNHSSGACTCGGRGAKKGTAVGKVHHCGCETGKPCSCHGKRKTDSKLSVDKIDEEISDQGKVRQIGMDPLASAKPTTETTRTRVGEVSVPLNEYIPSNHTGIGNVNDKIPEGFFQDVPLPFEPGHGLLDLFSKQQQQQQQQLLLQQQHQQQQDGRFEYKRSSDSSSISPDSNTANPIQSPIEQINDFFPYFPLTTSTTPSISSNGIKLQQRTESTSTDSSRVPLSITDSMDSLLTQDMNYHHYDNMIHKPNNTRHPKDTLFGTFERDLQQHNPAKRDDQSGRSVEVLSLTPTFLDIPNEFKDSSYFDKEDEKDKNEFTSADAVLSLPNELNAL